MDMFQRVACFHCRKVTSLASGGTLVSYLKQKLKFKVMDEQTNQRVTVPDDALYCAECRSNLETIVSYSKIMDITTPDEMTQRGKKLLQKIAQNKKDPRCHKAAQAFRAIEHLEGDSLAGKLADIIPVFPFSQQEIDHIKTGGKKPKKT